MQLPARNQSFSLAYSTPRLTRDAASAVLDHRRRRNGGKHSSLFRDRTLTSTNDAAPRLPRVPTRGSRKTQQAYEHTRLYVNAVPPFGPSTGRLTHRQFGLGVASVGAVPTALRGVSTIAVEPGFEVARAHPPAVASQATNEVASTNRSSVKYRMVVPPGRTELANPNSNGLEVDEVRGWTPGTSRRWPISVEGRSFYVLGSWSFRESWTLRPVGLTLRRRGQGMQQQSRTLPRRLCVGRHLLPRRASAVPAYPCSVDPGGHRRCCRQSRGSNLGIGQPSRGRRDRRRVCRRAATATRALPPTATR